MGRLIILSRPGIMVVSGVVKEVDLSRATVVIENDVLLPCSGVVDRRRIRMVCDLKKIYAMRLNQKIGSFILASVRPSDELVLLEDGGEDDTTEYCASVYNMRFSGSFDFDRRGEQKEEHVFCASIKKITFQKFGDKVYAFFYIQWNKQGYPETKTLVVRIKNPDSVINMKRGIFVCGAMQKSSLGDVYKIFQMDLQA